ncbi:MAG: RNA-directed DNA polymerase [Myxococcales bacterium]|jgi:retron-type reverse transcriptase|nr:RNA-directed DNA polymerase [Myxococcales bacterium]MBL0194981.1 RNA-directed DNA polymerase [Myxococcales bacterium]HQY61719.1 reverse transcriptase family protein [Polyangiaceae bacterium]
MDRRQQLYDRIRSTSKDEVVLEEMIRLGFWPARGTLPSDPGDEIRDLAEAQRELAALRTEQSRLHNLEALKKELFKRRLAESKARQAETKARRERERVARAEAWKNEKTRAIVFLGRGVSGGLADTTCDEARLQKQGLPVLRTAEDLARAAGVTVPELRFLAYARTTTAARVSHYRRFQIPKKTGGVRIISAPMRRLKALQRWLLDAVLARVEVHDAAHGFRAERSIVTNAGPHVGARVVVNLDLKDFFPTVTLPRIRGVFRSLGYGEHLATIFALLASEPDTVRVALDGAEYDVAQGPRRLPQGAPTSPAITNVLCRRLDRRLFHAAKKLGFAYSRYADDLTFSSTSKEENAGQLLKQVRFIVAAEGFVPHPDKTRVLRKGRQQEVTGVVVNDKLGVDRVTLRRFRALLHALDKDGANGKRWGSSPDVFASACGFASYVAMVDPVKGRALLARAREIAARHGWKGPPRGPDRSGGPSGPGGAPKPPAPATPSERAPAPVAGLPGEPLAAPPTPEPPAPEPPAPASPPTPETPAKKKWWKLF